MSLLHERLSGGNNLVAITHSNSDPAKKYTISGLGGIGKTQLAVAYANIYEKEYDFIGWISAENQAQLINSYRDILKEKIFAKGICEDEEISIDGKSKEEIKDEIEKIISSKNQQEIVKLLIDVLPKSRKRWLLIYDNAENAAELKNLMPVKGGHIIITSRCSDWSQVLPLDAFQLGEAVDCLFKATQKERTSSEEESAKQVAEELGCLPLALSQAAAYIREGKGKISFQEYLSDFQKRQPRLLEQPLSGDEFYNQVVMTTWDITMEKLMKKYPLSSTIIDRCGYLAPDNIPLTFFSDLPEKEVIGAARALNNYSMINFNEHKEEISLHRLVQAVTRIKLESKVNNSDVIYKLTGLLLGENMFAFIEDYSDLNATTMRKLQMLVPHVLSLISYFEHCNTNEAFQENAHVELSLRIAAFLTGQLQLEIAEPLLDKALFIGTRTGYKLSNIYKQLFYIYLLTEQVSKLDAIPKQYWDIMMTARWFRHLGKHDEAIELYLDLLNKWNSDESPPIINNEIAEIHTNLGLLYRSKRMFDKAQYHFELVRCYLLSKGPSLELAKILERLAHIYANQQQPDEAKKYYQDALKMHELFMLPALTVVSAHSNLASCFVEEGDVNLAEYNYYKDALKLGNESAVHCLYGLFLYKNRRYDEAIKYFTLVLNNQIIYCIDISYGIVGKDILDNLLQIGTEQLGSIGIDTRLLAYYYLIKCYHDMGNLEKAKSYFKEFKCVLEEFKSVIHVTDKCGEEKNQKDMANRMLEHISKLLMD